MIGKTQNTVQKLLPKPTSPWYVDPIKLESELCGHFSGVWVSCLPSSETDEFGCLKVCVSEKNTGIEFTSEFPVSCHGTPGVRFSYNYEC